MNASFSASTPNPARIAQSAATVPARSTVSHQRRERDFGVGYGNSSGYASPRRYVATSSQRLFRFA